jgi:hypothetical protein
VRLPPLLSSRPVGVQILLANVVPCVFGAVTGLMLGVNEIAYLVLVLPIGIAGGYFAGLEHKGAREGAIRGLMGGLQFGALILAVHELSGMDPKAELPHPPILLVAFTTGFGVALGALGGRTRQRRARAAQ